MKDTEHTRFSRRGRLAALASIVALALGTLSLAGCGNDDEMPPMEEPPMEEPAQDPAQDPGMGQDPADDPGMEQDPGMDEEPMGEPMEEDDQGGF